MAKRRKALFTKGEANAKTKKGEKLDFLTLILHLAPADSSGREVCSYRSPGCTLDCLNLTGRGGILTADETTNAVQLRRIARTDEYFADPAAFIERLAREITNAEKVAAAEGLQLVVRCNGTSDLPTIALQLAERFPHLTFYDYTKLPRPWLRQRANYHLTFSRSELNDAHVFEVLSRGGNVAVTFDTKKGEALPVSYFGVPVLDGDDHDLRFLDPTRAGGYVIGLRYKLPFKRRGEKRRAPSAFVVRVASLPATDRSSTVREAA